MTKRANLAAALHDAGAKPSQGSQPAPAVPVPETSSPPRYARSATRDGQRSVTVYVNPEAHRQLRMLSVETEQSVQELMIEALNGLFQTHGKSLIA